MKILRILKTILMLDFLSGLFMAIREAIKPKKTLNYPFEKGKISPRARGEHALEDIQMVKRDVLHANYARLYVQLKLSQLSLQKEEDGSRKTTRYDIDMLKCIYCGLCEESCPVDAIVQGPNFEFATETREELYYNKEKLLENGDRWESVLAANIKADSPYR